MSGARNASQMFSRFLERISDCAIFVLDRGGCVQTWNEGARAILGFEAPEILGQHAAVFFEPEARAAGAVTYALQAAERDGRFESEGWQVCKGGARLWSGLTVTAIADDAEGVVGFGLMLRDLTERRRSEQQKASVIALLEKTAGTDFLTGALNRRALDAGLRDAMAAASSNGRPLSLAMVDLDNFKAFNDAEGHPAGDRYLNGVVAFWRGVLRGDSLLARYGGEEFTVVMPNTSAGEALEAMQRLRAATPAPLTCSVGVAQWDGAEAAEALISRADRGLYRAKANGRNRVELGAPTDSAALIPDGRRSA